MVDIIESFDSISIHEEIKMLHESKVPSLKKSDAKVEL
jgi:hypothetical protein